MKNQAKNEQVLDKEWIKTAEGHLAYFMDKPGTIGANIGELVLDALEALNVGEALEYRYLADAAKTHFSLKVFTLEQALDTVKALNAQVEATAQTVQAQRARMGKAADKRHKAENRKALLKARGVQ